MRWPFRRNSTPGTTTVDSPGADSPTRQWAILPAIVTTVPTTAPLVVGPAPVVPLLRLDDRCRPTTMERPIGTVFGLAHPVVRVVQTATSALPAMVARRPVRRPVRPTVPTEVAPLVDAVDEYVGEPREPAEPHRAPGWLRLMPDWAKQAQPDTPAPAPDMLIAEPPSFLPKELRTTPPRTAPAEEPATPPVRRRRPNLGQSRRLGLGAPIANPDLVHPEPPPTVDEPVETPQEPPPPPAAPAQVIEPASPPQPVPATYRSTPDPRPAPRRERPRGTVVDRVPAPLANEVRTRQRADVSDVPVYRGPQVGATAKARGARAFAAGGAVFLPDEAGPTDSPRARGLLAHELVHAVQQRTLGPRLPAPDSPLGQRLEAQAQAAERFYGGESGAPEPPPLIHAPAQAHSAPEPDLSTPAQLATTLPAAPPPLNSPFDAETTEEVGKIATESARHVVAEWTNPLLHSQEPTTPSNHTGGRREQLVAAAIATHNRNLAPGQPPVTTLSHDELAAIDHQIATGAQNHRTPPHSPRRSQPAEPRYAAWSAAAWMHAITGADTHYGFGERGLSAPSGSTDSWFEAPNDDPAAVKERNRPFAERLADQAGLISSDTATMFDTDTWWEPAEHTQGDDSASQGGARQGAVAEMDGVELDDLAARLYDRLRSRLRTELLVDRERAGLLTDFR